MNPTKEEFYTIIVGMVRSYKLAYTLAADDYVIHSYAVMCLKEAVGAGKDARTLAEDAKKLEGWVTLPTVGFVPLMLRAGGTLLMDEISGKKTPSLLREVSREYKGLNAPDRGLVKVKARRELAILSQMAKSTRPKMMTPRLKTIPTTRVFDPTGAINWGFRILVEIGPLLGKLQMDQARLMVMDPRIVPTTIRTRVGQVLQGVDRPKNLERAYKQSIEAFFYAWYYFLDAVKTMEKHRLALNLPSPF